MYHVKANISNGVSKLRIPVTVIQVGDNFTLVDVAVADWLVPVNGAVNLTMDVPRGWPIIMTVDMGDGQPPQRITRPAGCGCNISSSSSGCCCCCCCITRPAGYNPETEDRAPRRRGQGAIPASTEAHSRRRRDVDEPVTFGQPFVLSYQYRTQGSYKYVL